MTDSECCLAYAEEKWICSLLSIRNSSKHSEHTKNGCYSLHVCPHFSDCYTWSYSSRNDQGFPSANLLLYPCIRSLQLVCMNHHTVLAWFGLCVINLVEQTIMDCCESLYALSTSSVDVPNITFIRLSS